MAGVELPSVGKTKRAIRGKKVRFWGKQKSLDAELWVIQKALKTATRNTSDANTTLITIFCDSQKTLMVIWQPPSQKEKRFLKGQICYRTKNLMLNGHKAVCQWIQGHEGFMGNEKADLAAKNNVERGEN